MYIEEVAEYKVACYIDRRDMKDHGVTTEDIAERTQLGRMFFKKVRELAKSSVDYDWPECGYSMEMKFYPEKIVLIFSERVDDFIYNLKQSAIALPAEQAEGLQRFAERLEVMGEEQARARIREFEENIRSYK